MQGRNAIKKVVAKKDETEREFVIRCLEEQDRADLKF